MLDIRFLSTDFVHKKTPIKNDRGFFISLAMEVVIDEYVKAHSLTLPEW